jgi:hypothetical protein
MGGKKASELENKIRLALEKITKLEGLLDRLEEKTRKI